MELEFKRLSTPPWCGRRKPTIVRHGNHLVLLGGFSLENMATPINLNDVWRTSDGETWEQLAESGESRGLLSSAQLPSGVVSRFLMLESVFVVIGLHIPRLGCDIFDIYRSY